MIASATSPISRKGRAWGPDVWHGESKHKTTEYRSWTGMISRCHNPNATGYERYGGRGIRVCLRWRKSYLDFLADMGRKPSKTHSIDRIDNTKGYSPKNCRWATKSEQLRNTKKTIHSMVTIDGVTRHYADWAEINGLRPIVAKDRLRDGWDPIKAVTQPVRRWRKK